MIKINNNILPITVACMTGLYSSHVFSAEHITTYNAADYAGSSGTITFDDWGYTGPGGRTASDFSAINGFGGAAEGNSLDPDGGIGQIQHVITNDPDWNTPDQPQTVYEDFTGTDVYDDANLDSTTNFFRWAYTSPGGSTFNNMQIDYDGDYHVAQNDMNFEFYNFFTYNPADGSSAPSTNYTNLAFQPYALSDASGWCGSVMASHPNATEPMAGQLTFDFAFDVYFQNPDTLALSYASTEVVRGFQMRSWGDLNVDVTRVDGTTQQYSARAVVNNTDPSTIGDVENPVVEELAASDEYKNDVSFMGADVIASGGTCGVETAEWAAGNRGASVTRFASTIDAADSSSCAAAGGSWQNNSFAGFAFLLRADGTRYLDWYDEAVYGPDPSAVSEVPVPAAAWLFGSGLIGLMAVARRKRA